MESRKLQMILAIILFAGTSVCAQTQPNLENGYKAYGSYDGSNIDTINTMNGNLMLHLPMPFSYPQRGGKLNLQNLLTISSKNWSVQCTPGCHWTAGGGVAPLISEMGNGVGFDYNLDLSAHRDTSRESDAQGNVSYGSTYSSIATADGASHPLSPSPNAALDANGDPLSYDTEDLSGYHLDLMNPDPLTGIPTSGVVIDRNGNRYAIGSWVSHCGKPVTDNGLAGNTTSVTCSEASRTGSITDVNGNVITLSGSGLADSMGRPFTTFSGPSATSDYSGCVSSTWPLASAELRTYAAFNYTGTGTLNQIKLCYANVNVQTAFGITIRGGQTTVAEAQGVVPMLVTIVMPDGTSWKIDYDSYGNVTHLGLPLGGAIDYFWNTISPPSCGEDTSVSRGVVSRWVNDNNGHSWQWKYNYGAAANNQISSVVTDPLGNDTAHVFMALNGVCKLYYETTTRNYQGASSGGQILQQVDTSYQLIGTVPFATSYKTTVYPSNKVKLVQRAPDSGGFGLVAQELEYDWGQGAPGPLLRETDTVYQWQKDSRYLTARLLDLKSSVVMIEPNSANNTKTNCPVDGAGTTKACAAETDYTYDEAGYLQSYEAAANGTLPAGTHVAAPSAVRGNLTSVGRWLNTSGTVIFNHTSWFDTGMVYQSIDPLNHTSTQSYDLVYGGAFPTKTCDALNHCVSGTYDFTTGMLTSFTNQNGSAMASGNTPGDTAHTTTYGYDTLSRITLTSFPDGGRVIFNYSAPGVLPAYAEKLKKINSSLPDDDSFAYLDGLGRPFKGVHKTPNGDATVVTTYDAMDRAIKVTNPYLSTSDPTYGEIQTQYDALGRAIQITKQDGSFSAALYNQNASVSNGDCTTTTDEAGNQRRSCSDALGRLIEVDEPNPNAAATAATASLNVTGAEQTAMGSSNIAVPGSGFESPSMGTGSGAFQYHPAGSNWSFSSGNGASNGVFTGGAGLSGNSTAFTNLNAPAPEGVQVAFIQGGSANFFSQSLSGFQAGSYAVSFKAAQRGSNTQDFDVYLDSTLLGTFRPAGSTYTAFSTNAFTTTAGAHTLKFVGRDSAGGDNTAFIDAVQVSGTAPISDSGTVSLTVNGGTPYIYTYGANDTTGTIVNGLVKQIMADGSALVTATATVNNDIGVVGSGFESPSMGTGSGAFQYHPAGSNWSFTSGNGSSNGVFTGGAGLTGNGTGFTNLNPPAPEGLQVAFLQGGSANFLSQSLNGFQAGSYAVSFKAAQRGSNTQDFDVYLDSTLLGTFRPAGSTYTAFSTNAFTTTAGAHTLKFVGRDSAGGDNTAFIDAVQVLATAGSTINLTTKATGMPVNSYTVTASTTHNSSFTNSSFNASTSAFNGGKDGDALNNNPYVTQYTYDALGNLLRVNQNGDGTAPRIRSFTYDSLSRLLTATNPESGTITYVYDNAGNVSQKTSPAANQTGTATTTISFCYDAVNRPTGKAYTAQTCQNGQLPAGTAVVSYTYDVGSNTIGFLSSLTDQAGSASYSYDALGRVSSEQRTIGGISKSVSYDYYLDGSVNVIHYPSGAAVAYTVDAAGRTISVTDSVNGLNYVTGATYAPDSSVTGFVNGNSAAFAGISNAFSYNKRLQPINISAVTPNQQQVFSIGYDFHVGNGTSGSDNGNVYGITNGRDSSRGRTFTYDVLNRLTSAQTAGTDCTLTLADGHTKNWGNNYSYDAWGNLLGKFGTKCGAENVAFNVNGKNQLISETDPNTKTTIGTNTFDAAGNLTNDGSYTYNYDEENRVTGANGFTYTYDAAGNRVKKSNGTTGTLYWHALVGVIAETDLAGNNLKEYVFFNGTRIARKDSNGQVFYYFSDHLKTASVITDSAGNIKAESDYDPWGVERRVVDNLSNTYKFTGKERDGETGLDYFGARYYSSSMGRFMTPDWAANAVAVPYGNYGNPQSLNLYGYVRNNPITLVDPDGHADEENKKQNVAPPKSDAKPVKWHVDAVVTTGTGTTIVMGHSDSGETGSVTNLNNGLQTQMTESTSPKAAGNTPNTRTEVSDKSTSYGMSSAAAFVENRTITTQVYTKDSQGKETLNTTITKKVETMWSLYTLDYTGGQLTVTIKDPRGSSTVTVPLNKSQASTALAPGVVEGIDKDRERAQQQWERLLDRMGIPNK